jgi:AcrR family transcriptional regulator
MEMKKSTRASWLEAGVEGLRRAALEGHSDPGRALTLERLCEDVERTKGSFYHHFKNREDFEEALLEAWGQWGTEDVIGRARAGGDALGVLDALDQELLTRYDLELEYAVRVWSLVNERARAHVQRADRRRLRFLVGRFRELVADVTLARQLARQQVQLFAGAVLMRTRPRERRELAKLNREMLEQFLAPRLASRRAR